MMREDSDKGPAQAVFLNTVRDKRERRDEHDATRLARIDLGLTKDDRVPPQEHFGDEAILLLEETNTSALSVGFEQHHVGLTLTGFLFLPFGTSVHIWEKRQQGQIINVGEQNQDLATYLFDVLENHVTVSVKRFDSC